MHCLRKLSVLLAIIGFVSTNSTYDLRRYSPRMRTIDMDEPLYQCKEPAMFKKIDDEVFRCAVQKWWPLPDMEKNEPMNERHCCFKLDRECQLAKATKHYCEVRYDFDDSVRYYVEERTNVCKLKVGIDLSEEFCHRFKTTEVTVPLCDEYMNCSLKAEIKDISWKCDDMRHVQDLDMSLDRCRRTKWSPLLEDPKLYDKRKCCYFLDSDCQYNQLRREKCVVRDEYRFSKEVEFMYEKVKKKCREHNVVINEDICGQLKVKEIEDNSCKKYMKCRLNDTIHVAEPNESSQPGTGTRMTAQSWPQILVIFVIVFIERHLM